VLLLAAAVGQWSCAPAPAKTTKKKARAKEGRETLVDVPSASGKVTTKDIRTATYGVIWDEGGVQKQGTYKVSYVMTAGEPAVLESEAVGFAPATGDTTTSSAVAGALRRNRVKDYVLMSPIKAVIGSQRDFEVGKTYDGVMLRPDGRPHFRYSCDRMDEIAGMKGSHLTITSVKEGTTEMEVVLNSDFPFPLYVREHTGKEPVQVILKQTN
jgi:hypothetical protein